MESAGTPQACCRARCRSRGDWTAARTSAQITAPGQSREDRKGTSSVAPLPPENSSCCRCHPQFCQIHRITDALHHLLESQSSWEGVSDWLNLVTCMQCSRKGGWEGELWFLDPENGSASGAGLPRYGMFHTDAGEPQKGERCTLLSESICSGGIGPGVAYHMPASRVGSSCALSWAPGKVSGDLTHLEPRSISPGGGTTPWDPCKRN